MMTPVLVQRGLLLLFLGLGGAALGTGCVFNDTYCEAEGKGTPYCAAGGAGGATSSASTTSSMTTTTASSSSTGVVMDCIPTLTAGPKDDTCGVFVDPANGSDTAAGTMAAPQKTLGAALATWTPGKAIYVCDGVLSDTEPLVVEAGVVLYGGLDCAGAYKVKSAAARTALAPKAGAIPLTLSDGAATTELHQLAITASAAALPGSSAIGVVVADVTATLESVDITTGDAVAGVNSTTPTDNIGPTMDPTDSKIVGNPGANANTTTPTMPNPGGMAKLNPLCMSTGGKGGDGGEVVGTAQNAGGGTAGSATPLPTMGVNDGHGGIGDTGGGCTAGGGGKNGDLVLDGAGASGGTSLGAISLTGYSGVSGAPGPDGNPGQGGGGGGGAKGKVTPDTRGASGGGGGAGGCGGHGAPGGGPGGASIALILLGPAAPTLVDVTLVTGKGGDGGAGAAGQSGAIGGLGGLKGFGTGTGPMTAAACSGGDGGTGSDGGAGGGGRGGHSLGIAYVTALPASGFTVMHGAGGNPGSSAGAGTPADPGVADNSAQLPAQ